MPVKETFDQLFDQFENSPAHPFVKNELMPLDTEEDDSIDGSTIDDRELYMYFGNKNPWTQSKITNNLNIEPIERLEKVGSV